MIEGPDPEQYAEIFERCCNERGITYDQAIGAATSTRSGTGGTRSSRAAATRATFSTTWWTSPASTRASRSLACDMVDRACRSYFLDDSRKE